MADLIAGRRAPPKQVAGTHRSSLHDMAYKISTDAHISALHNHGDVNAHMHKHIMHVSGVPLRRPASCLSEAAGVALSAYRLRNLGHHLAYDGTHLLGQGGYAQVFKGEEVIPASAPSPLLAPVALAWGAINPWVASAKSLLGYLPFGLALTALASMSEEVVRRRVLAAAHVVGLKAPARAVSIPRAVKVLKIAPGNAGPHGCRSVEHEVLITLHVSHACAGCPYIGKAHAFEYVHIGEAAAAPGPPGCVDTGLVDKAAGSAAPVQALLLALEPYTVDLEAAVARRCATADPPSRRPAARTPTHAALLRAFQPLAEVSGQSGDSTDGASSAGHMSGLSNALDAAAPAAAPAPGTAGARAVNLCDYLLWLKHQGRRLHESEMKRLALQLAQAVHALHTQALVMHLDIKPSNVVLDSNLDVKLVDLGLAAAFTAARPYIELSHHGRGTPRYTCPEMIYNVPGLISPSADTYSFGCCLLTLCGDHLRSGLAPDQLWEPFCDLPRTDILLHLRHQHAPTIPDCIPAPFRSIIVQCLTQDPARRPSTQSLLSQLEGIDTGSQSIPYVEAVSPLAPRGLRDVPSAAPLGCWQPPKRPRGPVAPAPVAVDVPSGASSPGQARACLAPFRRDAAHALCGYGEPRPPPPAASLQSRSDSDTLGSYSGLTPSQLWSSPGAVHPGPGNTLAGPADLGDSTDLGTLSVRARSTQAMRYTKSLRSGLAAVMAPCTSSGQCAGGLSGVMSGGRTSLDGTSPGLASAACLGMSAG